MCDGVDAESSLRRTCKWATRSRCSSQSTSMCVCEGGVRCCCLAPRSVVHGSFAWFLLPWALLFLFPLRRYSTMSSVRDRYGLSWAQLVKYSLVSSNLNSFCVYAWYQSLSRTTVATNNSIYQVRSPPQRRKLARFRTGRMC